MFSICRFLFCFCKDNVHESSFYFSSFCHHFIIFKLQNTDQYFMAQKSFICWFIETWYILLTVFIEKKTRTVCPPNISFNKLHWCWPHIIFIILWNSSRYVMIWMFDLLYTVQWKCIWYCRSTVNYIIVNNDLLSFCGCLFSWKDHHPLTANQKQELWHLT